MIAAGAGLNEMPSTARVIPTSNSIVRCGSAPWPVLMSRLTRRRVPLSVQLTSLSASSMPFGTTTSAPSKVVTIVARKPMSRTRPVMPATSTVSPRRIGRSNIRIIPATIQTAHRQACQVAAMGLCAEALQGCRLRRQRLLEALDGLGHLRPAQDRLDQLLVGIGAGRNVGLRDCLWA